MCEAEADRAVDVDYADRYGLIATRGEDGRSVGHSGYFRSSEGRAEIAFAVSDELQGHGLGTILLAHLRRGGRSSMGSTPSRPRCCRRTTA